MMEVAGSGADPVIAGVPLAQFAAVTAALGEAFTLRAVLAVEGLDATRWAEADRGWTARLADDPALLARYEAELDLAQSRLYAPEDTARAGKPRLVRSGTGLAAGAVANPVTSAAPAPAPLPPPAPPPLAAAPVPKISDFFEPDPPSDRQETIVARAVRSQDLPFRAAPAAREPIPRAFSSEDAGTLTAFEVPSAALPFRSASAPVEPLPSSPRPAPPSPDDGGTRAMRAYSGPSGAILPFRAHPSIPPPPPPPPVMQPPLSLEQHASLCLEIALDPARVADVLVRYQMSAADREYADEFYRRQLAADPALRARWNHAYEVYHAWFISRPRP